MMEYLKIKDDVDLKELEKFGFKLFNCAYLGIIYYEFEYDYNNGLKIDTSSRRIHYLCEEGMDKCLPKVFDLIQAGLVEKVVE